MSVAPESYQQGYSGFAKSLHWIVALLVLTAIPVGILMGQIENAPFNLFNFHKSLGVAILLLMTIRLIYRIVHGAPPEPNIPALYRYAGKVTHWALYILLFLTPISGAIANMYYGATTPFFGLFEIQPLFAKNEDTANFIFARHKIMGFAIGVLAIMHIGAALFHYVIRKDGVLERMLPGR
ncbi:MAG TPA: cytochrome b [Xanthobacteraceae bacterium]|nr:cytochrome b [Xanthobacteraceae bacterium]